MNADFMPPHDPWQLFAEWYAYAQKHEPSYPDAMTLGTVGEGGMPSLRTVLMKDYNQEGLVFYTNQKSRKGQELAAHPQASLCFYWKSVQRQIRIEGQTALVSAAESDVYFATRPRGSQIGAWASLQSEPLENRAELEERFKDVERRYEGLEIPRPPHWGGYRLCPSAFEFWQERDFRLHDRVIYTQDKISDHWSFKRAFP